MLSWNTKGHITAYHLLHRACIIAHDVIGGFFALNGGAFSEELGTVYYFDPHTLKWRGLGGTYSQLIAWALTGDLDQFYRDTRWPNWETEVAMLSGDQGISIYPFLCTEKNMPIWKRSRRVVPIAELWNVYLDLAQHLKDLPDGTPIQVKFVDNPDEHH